MLTVLHSLRDSLVVSFIELLNVSPLSSYLRAGSVTEPLCLDSDRRSDVAGTKVSDPVEFPLMSTELTRHTSRRRFAGFVL